MKKKTVARSSMESDDEEYNTIYKNEDSNIDLRNDCVLLLKRNHYDLLSLDKEYLNLIKLN